MSEFKQGLYHVKWWLRGVYGDPEGEFDILTSNNEDEIRAEAWRRAQVITSAGRPEYIEYTATLLDPADPPASDDEAWLADVRARLALITPGEWGLRRNTFMGVGQDVWVKDSRSPIAEGIRSQYDAAFIAAAPADTCHLLDALDAARRERDEAVTENTWLKRALKGFNADSQARFDAYWNEVFRVLEVNKVSSDAIYDAKHNASIILASVMLKQAGTQESDHDHE